MESERKRLGLGVSLLMTGAAVWLAWPLRIAIRRGEPNADRGRRTVQRRRRAGARVLVVGDASAARPGVGLPRPAVAGWLAAAHPDWTIGNLARRGSRTADVARVLGRLARRLVRAGAGAVYDAVIIYTGGTDALRFTRDGPLSIASAEALAGGASIARHTLLVTDDNLALATAFPWPWSWVFGWRGARVRSLFQAMAWEAGVGDVDASRDEDDDDGSAVEAPASWASSGDGLESSDRNDAMWFAAIDAALCSRLGTRRTGTGTLRWSPLPRSAESLLQWDES